MEKYLPSSALSEGILLFGTYLAYMMVADRTPLFPKIGKVFEWAPFAVLMSMVLIAGVATLTDMGDSQFLNRHQTNEWKGWMQLTILVYHYVGASKISVVYNFVRVSFTPKSNAQVLVASYIFMTGYGHFSYFYKKKDFGIKRVAKILLRLNLVTVAMSYTMDQPLTFYYFAPLVSFWFLVIYFTMYIVSKYNQDTRLLLLKICFSMALIKLFIGSRTLIEGFFYLLETLFALDSWNAKEAQFRLGLDQWVLFSGVFVAWFAIQFGSRAGAVPLGQIGLLDKLFSRPTAKPESWRRIKLAAGTASIFAIGFFFLVDFTVSDKFAYNRVHPWLSLFPVLGYTVLRNYSDVSRRYNSRFWIWVGTFSLETFLLQVHESLLNRDLSNTICSIISGWR